MSEEKNFDLDLDEGGRRPVARVMMVEASGFTREGVPTITIDCETPRDLDREIERLKEELDGISARAAEALGGTSRGAAPKPESSKTAITKPHLDSDLRVADVMTRDVRTVRRNDRIAVADELMKVGSYRHIVVVDDEGRLAGVVSHRDIVYGALAWTLGQGRAAHDKALEAYPVKDVMASEVVTVDSETPLRDAAAIMLERKIGCLPIVDGGVLVGILTEGDFLFLLTG
ncbi:MAG: CBS domain-containing protein [Myxococcales bacterium]|nr:CBS domain-containing protein [Myxococcales bacterium]